MGIKWLIVKNLIFFLLPALILITVFLIYPVVHVIYLSFIDEKGNFVGLDNYIKTVFRSDVLDLGRLVSFLTKSPPYGALIHNILWILIHLPLTVFLGLFLAVILRNVKGASVIKAIIFLGMIVPMVVSGIVIHFTFEEETGIVNVFLRLIGIAPKSWLAYPETALYTLILGSVWLWTGFSMIVYSAGLESIPRELYEAAEIDGATALHKFLFITLPLLKPVTITVVTMTVLWELKMFDYVFTSTRGGPGGATNVMALQIYHDYFVFREPDLASALASILTLITLGIALVALRPVLRTRVTRG
ncbi:MAG: sugar ABC transporter permease [Thermoprotei archaeon]|nr:MAG: sugar ABC transporter permease [Thermoprotei archaeon]